MVLTVSFGFATNNHPVSWTYDVEEIGELTYKINVRASIKAPYHIYPQSSAGGGGMGMPTEIVFSEDPNIEYVGKIEEKGMENSNGKRVAHYSKGVTFSQIIRLKSDKPITIHCQVKSMACTNVMCMPPSTNEFSISINKEDVGIEK